MKLSKEEVNKFSKKLEYRFKKSSNPLVERLSVDDEVELSEDEVKLLYSKLEYNFKKSGDVMVTKLKEELKLS